MGVQTDVPSEPGAAIAPATAGSEALDGPDSREPRGAPGAAGQAAGSGCLEPGPRGRTAGGGRGVAPAGPVGPAQPRLLPALGQPGHTPPLGAAQPLAWAAGAGRGAGAQSRPRKGQLFMGRLGLLPMPALASVSQEEWSGGGGEKMG